MNEFENRVRRGVALARTSKPVIKNIQTTVPIEPHIPYVKNVPYVPDVVADKTSSMKGKCVLFTVNGTTDVCLTLLHSPQRLQCSECFFVEFVKTVITVIGVVFRKVLPRVDVVLILLCLPKKLDGKVPKVVSHEHINTGYSSVRSSDDVPYTYVYRTEEMCKVLIHELLHMYGVHSFRSYPRSCDDKIIKEMSLDVKPGISLNLFEAYVEMCSLVINSIMFDDYFGSGNNALEKEVQNSTTLLHQLISYRPYREETNVYAYVFLKYDLLVNRDTVFGYTQNDDFVLNNVKTILGFRQYHTYHNEFYDSKLTLNKMDIYTSFLKRFKDFLSIHE